MINNKSSYICIYSFYKAITISSKYDVDVLIILFSVMKSYDSQKYKGYNTIRDNQPVPPKVKTYDPQPYRNFTDTIAEESQIPEIKQYVAEKFVSKNFHNFMVEQFKKGRVERTFTHQEDLPNSIKHSGRGPRRTSCVFLKNTIKTTLGNLFSIYPSAKVYKRLYLHTTTEAATLLMAGVLEPIRMEQHEVLEILNPDRRIENTQIQTFRGSTTIVMEMETQDVNPTIFKLGDDLIQLDQSYETEYKSFIRKPMSLEDIRQNLRFISIITLCLKGALHTLAR